MSFEDKKERAFAIMESKKMWRSNYAPTILRGLWKLGLEIPPLPFASFYQVSFLMGGAFCFLFWIPMWLFVNYGMYTNPVGALISSIPGGVIFGLIMAIYHAWRRKANNLPDWKDI